MMGKGHGVGDELQPIVQGAIVLDVDVLGGSVCKRQQMPGVGAVLSRSVDLQLYSEKAGASSMEDGAGVK